MSDFIGKKFGRLTVIAFVSKDKSRKHMFLCKCDCGKEKVVSRNNLVTGTTKSCGCIKVELLKSKAKKYSKNTHEKLYNTWAGMKQRCYNPNAERYTIYGARGIQICDKWKNSFVDFAEWALLNGYQEGLSIDRIDPNGNYEPSNCRWATLKEQSNNKRRSIKLKVDNQEITIPELSKKLGVSYSTVYSQVKAGKYATSV